MIVLASASPRRRELLRVIAEDFAVIAPDVDEDVPPHATPEQTVLELARRKAEAVARTHPQDIVIGSDTVVELDGRILGKPADQAEAATMLRLLSGRVHRVSTGVAVLSPKGAHAFAETAQVEFIPLTDAAIAAYVDTGEPMDKAGAYGIQGKGALFVAGIHGDYYTVMGLPVCRLGRLLAEKYGVGWA